MVEGKEGERAVVTNDKCITYFVIADILCYDISCCMMGQDINKQHT